MTKSVFFGELLKRDTMCELELRFVKTVDIFKCTVLVGG